MTFEFVRVIVSKGRAKFESRLVGSFVTDRFDHDEDVRGWSERELRSLAAGMLDVPEAEREKIEVIWQ
jgi:hypothetical protein